MVLERGQSLFPSTMALYLLLTLALSSVANTTLAISPSPTIQPTYIVSTVKPKGHPRDFAIHLLTSVLGSQKAAEEALGYVYRYALTGFSARLTPEQASTLENQPGVLSVAKSITYHLDRSSPFGLS